MEQYIEFASNHYILTLAFMAVSFMLFYSLIGDRFRAYKSLSPSQAVNLINHENATIVDVREANEYANGHIVNSIHIPMSFLRDRIKDIEKYKSNPIILSCRSGQRSAQACQLLTKNGFETVYNLNGGIMAWQNESLPLTKK